MIHYAAQLYQPKDPDQFDLLVHTLEHNLQLAEVESATIFLDGCDSPWSQRSNLNLVRLDRHATFADFLALPACIGVGAAHHLLFANSDIQFDSSCGLLAQRLRADTSVACITRQETQGVLEAPLDPMQSQDAWMLRVQLFSRLLLDQLAGLRLGVPGCEHLLASVLVGHGFDLWNPSLDCRAWHMDPKPMAYQPGGERYWGFYAYVPACWIADVEELSPEVQFSLARQPGAYSRAWLD